MTKDDYRSGWRKRLFEEHSPEETGTWRILGEDPNCDFGGAHHEPHLETVTGTYKNVVEYAMTLRGWETWGHGGRIIKEGAVKNIDKLPKPNPKIAKLEEERERLRARLADIDVELKKLV